MPSSRDEKKFKNLQRELQNLPWVLNGSVMKIAPRSPSAKTTYTWTRKIRAKTVTVALSLEQYVAFKKAIDANRKLEKTIKQMRVLSEKVLLETLPGVQRKPRAKAAKTPRKKAAKTIPNSP